MDEKNKKRSIQDVYTLVETQNKKQKPEYIDISSLLTQLFMSEQMLGSVDIKYLINIISTCKTYHNIMKKHIEQRCYFLYYIGREQQFRIYKNTKLLTTTTDTTHNILSLLPVSIENRIGLFLPTEGFPISTTHLLIGIKMNHSNSGKKMFQYQDNEMQYGHFGHVLSLYGPCGFRYDVYNGPINLKASFITHLAFGCHFNHPIDGLLPETLTHLFLGIKFNHPVNELPSALTYLSIISKSFNRPVNSLPKKLTNLHLGKSFNQSVDNLPVNLTHLVLDDMFNQPLIKLPNLITHLILGHNFNHHVNMLPTELRYLVLGHKFNQELSLLPDKLIHLDLTKSKFFSKDLSNIPNSIIHIGFWGASKPMTLPLRFVEEAKNPSCIYYFRAFKVHQIY